jgi:hypothetical protein
VPVDFVLPSVAKERSIASIPEDLRTEAGKLMETAFQSSLEATRALDRFRSTAGVTPEAAETVREFTATSHGTRVESSIREAVEAKSNVVIRTSTAFRTQPWFTLDDERTQTQTQVFLGGRFDGFDEEKQRIVEIKARQRRHLGVPLYERVQIHGYCFIYGVRDAVLVDNYLNDNREHVVPFDEALWADVTDKTKAFLQELVETIRDSSRQHVAE